jgi:hypothetical protein
MYLKEKDKHVCNLVSKLICTGQTYSTMTFFLKKKNVFAIHNVIGNIQFIKHTSELVIIIIIIYKNLFNHYLILGDEME